MAQQAKHGVCAGVGGVPPCPADDILPAVAHSTCNMRHCPPSSASQSVRLSTRDGDMLLFSSLAAAASHLLASGDLDLRLI